jgi:dihydrofolate synthase / folylpolyglutamate synthase
VPDDSPRHFDFPEAPLIPPETEAESWLYGLSRFGMKLGLANIIELARRFGNPQHKLRFLHVAGTNGKGSVCFYLESLLKASGHSVGVFASPHLIHVGERIRVKGELLSHDELANYVHRVRADVEELCATFFETMTLIALLRFADAGVDFVAWETGLGGRYDSTRVAYPAASAITRVGLDHTKYLGTTLEEIAADKMGIGKPGVPLYTGQEPGALLEFMKNRAIAENLDLIHVSPLCLDGLMPFQQANAALALGMLQGLDPGTVPTDFEEVLRNTSLPGRFHVLRENPLMVIDGGHNPQALEAVLGEWDRRVPEGGTIIFGCSADKEVDALLALLKAKPRRMIFTRAQNPRSINPDELYDRAGKPETWTVATDFGAALATVQEGPLLVTGSFYLAGEAYWQMGVIPFE